MPRRRKKKVVRPLYPSAGALPLRFADRFAGCLLVFSDASRRAHGGLAAVLFAEPDGEPLVGRCTVPLAGSNELELQAALFGLAQAARHFPGRALALFSDNQDAIERLSRAQTAGLADDPVLAKMLAAAALAPALANMSFCWIKGHSTCRGNILADQHAAQAAA